MQGIGGQGKKIMMQIPTVYLLGEDWEAISMYMSIDSS